MKSLLTFLAVTSISIASSAHFKIGTYTGQDSDGAACTFEIKSVSFKGDLHHPLAEQVYIEFADRGEMEFTHLGQVDLETLRVRPKAHVLSHIAPMADGAEAFELLMGEEGPIKFVKVTDNYRDTDSNTIWTCSELSFSEGR